MSNYTHPTPEQVEEINEIGLTNGLSVTACGQTLVCDRARPRVSTTRVSRLPRRAPRPTRERNPPVRAPMEPPCSMRGACTAAP